LIVRQTDIKSVVKVYETNTYDIQMIDPHRKGTTEDPPPPCDSCRHARICTTPDRCRAFRLYVKTGRQVAPPQELPG